MKSRWTCRHISYTHSFAKRKNSSPQRNMGQILVSCTRSLYSIHHQLMMVIISLCGAWSLSAEHQRTRIARESRRVGCDAMRLFFFVFRYLSTSALFLSLFRIEKPLQSEIATTKIYISRIYNIQFSRSRKPSGQQLLFKLCAHQSPLVCIWHGTTALQRFSIYGQLAMEKEHLQRAICVNGGK